MPLTKNSNYSYWEYKHYFKTFDLIVIGSGIVGLSTAISYKQKNKKASVLILEKGFLPDGGSTKNAGFACFGSAGELLDDLKKMPEESVWKTVSMRWEGLQLLRKRLGDKQINFEEVGGYEVFEEEEKYAESFYKINSLNKKVEEVLGLKGCYNMVKPAKLPLNAVHGVILNRYEGQLDSGKMMNSLLSLASKLQISVLNNVNILSLSDQRTSVTLQSNRGMFRGSVVVVATNGFAAELLNIKDVTPARAQVLVTKPIPNLKLKGTFHFDNGYYYFRNVDDRVLLGGGRNLDLKGETTTKQGLSSIIQNQLDHYLKNMILPNIPYEVEHRWSGIMGVGKEKKPIIQFVSKNVLAAVRMGGMGVAIGSWVGEAAAKELL
ncbi:MAG: FAD-dependent oxidoreductase [bacterium]|nr:FAD-dependent oxidoreductase [bacterium]